MDSHPAPDLLTTARLDLLPVTLVHAEAALADPARLAAMAGASLAPDWPPELLDEGALRWVRDALRERPGGDPWGMRLIIQRTPRVLVGVIGLKGPPDTDGEAELGYGVVGSHQRRGYATEATACLAAWVLAQPPRARGRGRDLPPT